MAELSEVPNLRVRHQGFDRARKILEALRSLRAGGTAHDVRKQAADEVSCDVSLAAVKTALWHLVDLGLAEYSDDGRARWWKATRKTE